MVLPLRRTCLVILQTPNRFGLFPSSSSLVVPTAKNAVWLGHCGHSRGCTTSSSPFSSHQNAPPDEWRTSSSVEQDKEEDNGVEVVYYRGLPQFTIPLPSRKERCRFIVKPLTNTVGDLLSMVKLEDKGIDRIALHSTKDGVRIGSSNTIEMLMEDDFEIIINDQSYRVKAPAQEKPSKEEIERLSSVRNLVGQLYAALNVDEHQLKVERELLAELETLQMEVGPLEEKRELVAQRAGKKAGVLTWVGLGLMSVQFGVLARLTWWEYSWDIMEPVTYFVTYGTAMLAYAYFVLTKQEYVLPDVKDRQYLITFHKHAKKMGMDVERYNKLKDRIGKIQQDLGRLRDPLALHLPMRTRFSGDSILDLSKEQSSYNNIIQKIQSMISSSRNTSA